MGAGPWSGSVVGQSFSIVAESAAVFQAAARDFGGAGRLVSPAASLYHVQQGDAGFPDVE